MDLCICNYYGEKNHYEPNIYYMVIYELLHEHNMALPDIVESKDSVKHTMTENEITDRKISQDTYSFLTLQRHWCTVT